MLKKKLETLFEGVTIRNCWLSLLSSAILAFGLYNIHAQSGVTEGGLLGLTLLLEHWLHISPAVSGFVMNVLCYAMGWKLFGRTFLVYSFISATGFSGLYRIFEQFDPVFPQIAQMPLVAAIVGALFVGISAGICVRIGGAPAGDDALAMSLVKLTGIKIQWAYFIFDIIVLGLSLSYIPVRKIFYSLLTVTISGQLVGVIQGIRLPGRSMTTEPSES